MRYCYTWLFALAIPFILLRLAWRGYKAPAYWQRWNERFGFYRINSTQNVIWLHTVSVGEVEAATPLIKILAKHYPQNKILLTTTTPTGSARVTANFSDAVEHVYLPYDLPSIIGRFIKHFKPAIAIILETEIWPNLYRGCMLNNIPLTLVNARLSDKSMAGYRLLPSLIKQTLTGVHKIAAQTDADRARFIALGVKTAKVQTTGNIKFDLDIPRTILQQGQMLRQMIFCDRLVWIIASTHQGEEEIFLKLYTHLKKQFPALLLVLVPRHPERFTTIKNLCNQHRLKTILRSSNMPCHNDTDVYIGDTMGELKLLYVAADISFVGGSMVPIGGHNVLEPAALGVPVMFGSFMENFKSIANGLLAQDAAVQCHNKEEIIQTFCQLATDKQRLQQLVERGKKFVLQNQGALQRVSTILVHMLDIISKQPTKKIA